jgi:hypothetical protein
VCRRPCTAHHRTRACTCTPQRQDGDYSDDVNLVSVAFKWDDDDDDVETKPIGTMLVGSTVEFEIALLTMYFLGGSQESDGENALTLGSENIEIVCHQSPKSKYGGPKIGTAYIEIKK